MRLRPAGRAALACWALFQAGGAGAVPPLVLGDVPTADPGDVELYLGTRYQRDAAVERQVPFTEVVLGLSGWQEITVEIPYLSQGGERGIGDAVLGTKLLLLAEADGRPGLAGSFEWKLTTGSQPKGLGTGSMEYDLRLRSQKTWGWFTLLGNLGYTFVGSPKVGAVVLERRNVGFAGLGSEVELAPGLRLLGEAYWRSADVPGGPARVAGDLGFKWGVLPHLAVHAAAGTSVRRESLGGPRLLPGNALRSWVGRNGRARHAHSLCHRHSGSAPFRRTGRYRRGARDRRRDGDPAPSCPGPGQPELWHPAGTAWRRGGGLRHRRRHPGGEA